MEVAVVEVVLARRRLTHRMYRPLRNCNICNRFRNGVLGVSETLASSLNRNAGVHDQHTYIRTCASLRITVKWFSHKLYTNIYTEIVYVSRFPSPTLHHIYILCSMHIINTYMANTQTRIINREIYKFYTVVMTT